MSLVRFTPEDNCLHGKYCGRFGMFVTTVEHKYESLHVSVTVPAGTPTDFASVPWPLTVIYPNVGPYARAALFHDQLYRQQTCSRRTADSIFLDIMLHDHTPKWQAYPIYWAVRIGGAYYWARQAERNRKAGK